jgi:hypothetical protein
VEKCPDNQTLALFLEHGLDEPQKEGVFAHLTQCGKCRQRVKAMVEEEYKLIASLLEFPLERETKAPRGKECPHRAILWSYAEGGLRKEHLQWVESHLETCDDCVQDLLGIQKLLELPVIEFNTESVLSTIGEGSGIGKTVRDRVKGKLKGGLELVLQMQERSLEVLQYTGELITARPQIAVRSSKQKEIEEARVHNTVCVRKDFEETRTSFEITVKKKANRNNATVKVSVMNLDTEEFLDGIMVHLTSQDRSEERRTNKAGEVEFENVSSGEYVLKLVNTKGQEIGHGVLTIEQ